MQALKRQKQIGNTSYGTPIVSICPLGLPYEQNARCHSIGILVDT